MAKRSRSQVLREVDQFLRGKQTKSGGTGRAGSKVSYTNLQKDLEGITEELSKKVIPTAVASAATIVRKEAVAMVRSGSRQSPSSSKKTKTRGQSPLRRYPSGVGMTNAGKGAWWGADMITRRGGPGGPSLGAPGTIIKKKLERKGYGLSTSQKVGPRYARNDPKGKNFAHTHEPKSGSTGAPNHKWWGKKAKKKLRARPFMGPAGEKTVPQQRRAIKSAIVKWKIKRPDLI